MSGMNPAGVRRIVTGTDEHGRSTITEGAAPRIVVPPETPDAWVAEQWVSESIPADLNAKDIAGRAWELEPPAGGSAFRLFQLPPRQAGGSKSEMHTTATIDYVVVLVGRIWLVVDTGEVELRPGDCVVQRGTPHAWENRGTEPCVMAGVLISAETGDR